MAEVSRLLQWVSDATVPIAPEAKANGPRPKRAGANDRLALLGSCSIVPKSDATAMPACSTRWGSFASEPELGNGRETIQAGHPTGQPPLSSSVGGNRPAQLLRQPKPIAPGAMATLVEMAKMLEAADSSVLTAAQREDGATWIGGAMFCIAKHWEPPSPVNKQAEKTHSLISGLFHATLRKAYEKGRKDAADRWQAVAKQREYAVRSTGDSSQGTTRKGTGAGARKARRKQDEKEKIRQATAKLEKLLDEGFDACENCYIAMLASYVQIQTVDAQVLQDLASIDQQAAVWRVSRGRQGEPVPLHKRARRSSSTRRFKRTCR